VKDRNTKPNPAIKTVLLYENFAVGVRAREFLKGLTRGSDKTLKEEMWNFEALRLREGRNAAASAARRADVLAVAVSGALELPGAIREWLDMWLWLLEDEKPALIALFDAFSAPNIAPIRAHLNSIARRVPTKFLFANRQVTLSPVVGVLGPHDYEIWPKSVAEDLLSWLQDHRAQFQLGKCFRDAQELQRRNPTLSKRLRH
jgi:hypothetical protein